MNQEEMKARTKTFALKIIKIIESFPHHRTAEVMAKQLLRSAMSVGANYRAACRAKSSADFIAKMGIVEEEADECIYWMELLVDSGLINHNDLNYLMEEANELLAITVASIKTARNRKR